MRAEQTTRDHGIYIDLQVVLRQAVFGKVQKFLELWLDLHDEDSKEPDDQEAVCPRDMILTLCITEGSESCNVLSSCIARKALANSCW